MGRRTARETLAERLRQVTAKRDRALAEVNRLREELALRSELAASGVEPAAATEGRQGLPPRMRNSSARR